MTTTQNATTAPHLIRTLKLRSLVLFGLAYMTPIIVLGIFGLVAATTGGATPAAYLLALIAMLFTASSYGRMAAAYPVAGSAYTYVRRAIDGRVGFLVGWAVMLDYLFLPMVIWLIGAAYLNAQFPAVPNWIWIIGFIAITTVLNIVGIKVAEKTNYALMAFQILIILIFVALSIASVLGGRGEGTLLSIAPFVNPTTSLAGISAGAAIAAYSFLGFDAVTTLTEETINPRKTVPRAILLVAIFGGAIFVVVGYLTQLVRPGGHFSSDAASASAAFNIAITIGGNVFGAFFLAGLVVAQFASGLAAQAGASRLLFAMGRDGVLPKRVFGAISKRFSTPMISILITGIVGLIALFISASTSVSFINFGAFTAFTMVNVSTLVYYFRNRGNGEKFNVFLYIVFPIAGAIVCLWLLTRLDSIALILGGSWLIIGIIYLGIMTRGFRKSPPEVAFEEAD
jgi:putrescine importer